MFCVCVCVYMLCKINRYIYLNFIVYLFKVYKLLLFLGNKSSPPPRGVSWVTRKGLCIYLIEHSSIRYIYHSRRINLSDDSSYHHLYYRLVSYSSSIDKERRVLKSICILKSNMFTYD